MRHVLFLFCLTAVCVPVLAQVMKSASLDTLETLTGDVGLGGYVDSYYSYNFNQPVSGSTPYFVSSARHNEVTINLAYIDVRFKSKFMRSRFMPGFGTYMDANYAKEPGSLKNLLEANVGVLLSQKRRIWLDAGVFSSPYTNESAISKDHLMYTRSLAPEYVPYYLTGIKASIPLSATLSAYLYLINGWQVIQDNNTNKALGTQLEYRPNNKMAINWNTYIGDERSSAHPEFRMRYFNDFYWVYNTRKKWMFTSCFYYGVQERESLSTATWWQANVIGEYKFTPSFSLSGRAEIFHDPSGVVVTSVTGLPGFRTTGFGLCANFLFHEQAMFRLEARELVSRDRVYPDKSGNPTNSSTLVVGSLTAWF
jgi:Putative beta-barrel porin-2, OmpL-like. bbp2